MWKVFIGIVLVLSCQLEAQAQRSKKKPKNSYAKGTLFGYWGYNRSAYTKSDINFVGQNYDFTLEGAKAIDRPSRLSSGHYFDVTKLTVPQFNARVGYYFWNNFSLSFGYDHMKYILDHGQNIAISGNIAPGEDAFLNGTYNSSPYMVDSNRIHYENSDGLNYLRFELTRTDQWYTTRDKNFAFNTQIGVSVGGLLSFNDFFFGQEFTRRTISLSGSGVSAHLGARFDFFKHVFLQTSFSGGLHVQSRVKNRPNNEYAYTKHKYGYGAFETVIGFLLYIRPTNGCDTCPHW